MRRTAQTLALVALFSACGRLDLGGYATPVPRPADENAVGGQRVALGGAAGASGSDTARASSAGHAPSFGGDAETAATGGTWPGLWKGDGGDAIGVAGSAEALGGAGAGGDGESSGGTAGDASAGAAGASDTPAGKLKSCRELSDICGSESNRSCCSVGHVPAGEFIVGLGQAEAASAETPVGMSLESHVSSFGLGHFEVTVGRFRAFLNAYDDWRANGALRAGAGSHPLIPGSGWDPAWLRKPNDPSDQPGLGATGAEIEAQRTGCLEIPLATTGWPQPVNCVSFYEAEAFCIWDGGRLPTSLEWEYAAAGAEQNRTFPWGSAEPDHGRAMYGCSTDLPSSPCLIPPVGSYPEGVGRFGQLDLAGSVEEWTFDTVGVPRPIPCNDCASVAQLYERDPRVVHGGSWNSVAEGLLVATSGVMESRLHLPMFGFRCAYDLP